MPTTATTSKTYAWSYSETIESFRTCPKDLIPLAREAAFTTVGEASEEIWQLPPPKISSCLVHYEMIVQTTPLRIYADLHVARRHVHEQHCQTLPWLQKQLSEVGDDKLKILNSYTLLLLISTAGDVIKATVR